MKHSVLICKIIIIVLLLCAFGMYRLNMISSSTKTILLNIAMSTMGVLYILLNFTQEKAANKLEIALGVMWIFLGIILTLSELF